MISNSEKIKWTAFSKIQYKRPDMNGLSDAFRRCRLRLRLSMSAHAGKDALLELQKPLLNFLTMAAYARIRHDQDMTEHLWQEETNFFDSAEAQVENWRQSTYHALLSSRFLNDLKDSSSDGLFRQAEILHDTVQDRILADISEENRLKSAYLQKIAGIRVEINDNSFTLAELEPLLEDRDPAVRRSAHRALNDALSKEKSWLDTCFDQLVDVRHRMSVKLGYANFTELGYKRMGRLDYGLQDVARFRSNVQKYIVPVCREIRRLQKQRLDISKLHYWDLPVLLPDGNPSPLLKADSWVQPLSRLLENLLGEADFLEKLNQMGYIDLQARPDKAAGGYCTTLYETGLPFILTNLTDRANDVMTLIHETGHAYAGLASLEQMQFYEDHLPGMDVCEIHSTALEFLCAPLLENFFAEKTQLHAMIHLTEALLFLPYACQVDHFQQHIYEHPEMKASERHSFWHTLENLYQPDLDYGEDEYFAQGCAWHKKEHIFAAPFYYIDYALAILASLDLWQAAKNDPDKSVRRYKRLCRRGNNGGFLSQLEESGIASPFEEETFKRLVYAACSFLSL